MNQAERGIIEGQGGRRLGHWWAILRSSMMTACPKLTGYVEQMMFGRRELDADFQIFVELPASACLQIKCAHKCQVRGFKKLGSDKSKDRAE